MRRQCARFVQDNARGIAEARPELPAGLNDRAGDIWEPLLALADLAGGDWPGWARAAALELTALSQETNPIGSLLLDMFIVFELAKAEKELEDAKAGVCCIDEFDKMSKISKILFYESKMH